MFQRLVFTIASLLMASSTLSAGIVDRAESTELRYSNGTERPRVTRNDDGQVTILILSDMKLSPQEIEELTTLEHLRALVLFHTNVTDQDLKVLKKCRRLDHINLTGTEVTDDAIDTLLEFEHLQSLCLGNVRITPAAIEKLKERNRTSNQDLRWGYSHRKD